MAYDEILDDEFGEFDEDLDDDLFDDEYVNFTHKRYAYDDDDYNFEDENDEDSYEMD